MRRKLVTVVCFALGSTMTFAGPLSQGGFPIQIHRSFEPFLSDSVIDDETDLRTVVPDQLRRRIVNYPSTQAPGTVVVDTPNTYLYYVIGGGKAIRYGIGVGREGFTWSGVKTVDQKSEWPDWIPLTEMIQRQPYLPRFMAGGPRSGPERSILAGRSTAFMAPTHHRQSENMCPAAVFVCSMKTLSIFMRECASGQKLWYYQ